MGAATTRSLYLSVSGDVTNLTSAAKAGKSVLLSLGDAAIDVQEEVKKAFADMGANAPAQAKLIERSYADTFATIRKNAQAVLDAPTGKAALQVINTSAAQEAAKAAEAQAVALRQVAAAAATVADRAGAAGAAERVLAVAAASVAERAEQEAVALRNQANVLGTVEAEIRATAGGVDDAADKVVNAHGKMGNSGAILQHVVRSTTDSFAAGLPVSIIFAEQIGRLGEAASFAAQEGKLSSGAFLKFGEVMSGPWGVAILAGVAVATTLVSKLLEGGDAVAEETKKLAENAKQAEISERAKKAFIGTEAGLVDDVRSLTEELKKQNDALRTNAELSNIRAKKDLKGLEDKRPGLKTELSSAQQHLTELQASPTNTAASLAAIAAAQARVAAAKRELGANSVSIGTADAAVQSTRADLAAEAAKREADPLERIKRKYEGPDGLIEQAKKRAIAEGTVTTVLTRQLTALALQQKAETEVEQKRQSDAKKTPTGNNNQIGREVTIAEATAIAASIGGHVTSGYRSHEKQEQLYADHLAGRHAGPVAKPGNSAHESGQAIDIAYGPGISVASIRQAFAKEGVAIRQLLDERDQKVFHVAFGKKGPSADTVARREEAKVTKAANDDRAFTNAGRQADDALARAKLQLTDSVQDEYAIKLQQIAADLELKNHAITDEVTAGKLTQAQAYLLQVRNAQLAEVEEQVAAEKLRVALAKADFDDTREARTARVALLQIGASLAITRKEQLAYEQKLLREQQGQRRDDLNLTIATTADPRAKTRAQTQLNGLPDQEKAENANLANQHLDPLETYKRQLYGNVHDMKDALKGVEVDGLRSIEDGFAGIINGTETVAGAFKKMASAIIADLVRIAAEKAILSVLGFSTGGEVGKVIPEQHAGGGFISGKGSGTSDDILSWLSNGEFVMNAAATRKHLPMLRAMNDNRLPGFATGGLVGSLPSMPTSYPAMPRAQQLRSPAQQVAVKTTVDVNPSPLFETQTRTIAQQTVGQAAQPIMMGATAQTMKKLRRGSLPGGYA